MRIGGLQKVSLIDYPEKVAAVIFTQGCNFRCGYCHNRELVLPSEFQTPLDEDAVFSFLEKRRGRLQGVVVTGGEPTHQKDLLPFLRKLRTLPFDIKLDTNGSYPDRIQDVLDEKLVDFIAMDIKSSPEKYEMTVGVRFHKERIKTSIDLIMASGIEYEFRTTLVKPYCFENEMPSIRKMIEGAKRYRLQSFVSNEKVLNKELLDQEQYSQSEFEKCNHQWSLREGVPA